MRYFNTTGPCRADQHYMLPPEPRLPEALELKVWRDGEKDPLAKGLAQLDGYLDHLELDTGVLVIFDRRSAAAPLEERTAFEEATSSTGRNVLVLRG